MGKVQVIFKKEEIKPGEMAGKTAVVFDVLFATTTITAALADGAVSVIPVLTGAQAREKAKTFKEPYVLAGEDQGKTLEGFHHPLRTFLQPVVKNKHLILSTTNGTVALQRSSQADHLYAASLLNNQAVARRLYEEHRHDTILLICSGTSGDFTMEDFFGAGSLMNELLKLGKWDMSDAARTALLFYRGIHQTSVELLRSTRIGQLLIELGMDPVEINFASQEGIFDTIPKYDPEEGQLKED
ncbi:2-phosphosulfolactate phosphatase [Halobacillus rhizosphaerae]|uniref:2-phosphosulfolactate phosphatase n=1 Tax=Halobacillus rhizosphaerae TaxID=3064889 RepID=UPI00398B5B1A